MYGLDVLVVLGVSPSHAATALGADAGGGDGDVELLKAFELDDTAGWVVTLNGRIAGAGGILYNHRSTKDKPVPNSDRFALALSQIAEKGLQSRELTGNVEGSF